MPPPPKCPHRIRQGTGRCLPGDDDPARLAGVHPGDPNGHERTRGPCSHAAMQPCSHDEPYRRRPGAHGSLCRQRYPRCGALSAADDHGVRGPVRCPAGIFPGRRAVTWPRRRPLPRRHRRRAAARYPPRCRGSRRQNRCLPRPATGQSPRGRWDPGRRCPHICRAPCRP